MNSVGSPQDSEELESALAIVVLRVWREPDHGSLRGRLVAPGIAEPTAADGRAQILALVDRALAGLER
jgi:hypothetical protein